MSAPTASKFGRAIARGPLVFAIPAVLLLCMVEVGTLPFVGIASTPTVAAMTAPVQAPELRLRPIEQRGVAQLTKPQPDDAKAGDCSEAPALKDLDSLEVFLSAKDVTPAIFKSFLRGTGSDVLHVAFVNGQVAELKKIVRRGKSLEVAELCDLDATRNAQPVDKHFWVRLDNATVRNVGLGTPMHGQECYIVLSEDTTHRLWRDAERGGGTENPNRCDIILRGQADDRYSLTARLSTQPKGER